MTKAFISDLIIETTRRCNMRCAHCVRGDAENMDMDEKYLEAVLSHAAGISLVTFSGGEPSLVIPLMRRFYELAEKHGCVPDSFYIVTNAKENQTELLKFAIDAWLASPEKDYCGLAVSKDEFHEPADGAIFGCLAFANNDKDMTEYAGRNPDWMIREGRAADNGMGHDPLVYDRFSCEKADSFLEGTKTIAISDLYLSCNGYLYPDCNLSYDHMDEMMYEEDAPCVPVMPEENGTSWTDRIIRMEESEE